MLLALAMVLSLSGLTMAQEVTGSIVGTVRDASGAAVPGATVTITDPSKNNVVVRTTTTSDDGEFSAPNLIVSVYAVTVEAANFKKSVVTDIKLDVGTRRQVEVTLQAGRIEETVTVESDPVSVELSTPTAGTVVSGEQVRELSLNNRNFVQLVTLAPGVSADLTDTISVGSTDPQTGAVNLVSISVNGARSSQNTYTVDGADITDRGSNLTIQAYPSVDSIGEFRVLRSLYPAESGRSGGGQVNVVTRSGTDRFSGTLYEFVRNEVFNANDYFTNQTKAAGVDPETGKANRRPFRYNNFGWTLAGPVYFFNFGERDPDDSFFAKQKGTYFFFSQEWRKDIRYPALASTVPSLAQRQGIFSVPICLQATGTTCTTTLAAGTPLSTVRPINPVAQQYLTHIYNKLPAPTSGANTLTFPAINKADFRQEIIKFDHNFTKNWSGYYRYQRDDIPTLDANSLFSSGSGLPGVSTTRTDSPGRTHTAQMTYVLNPRMIIEGRYTYSYGAILSENVGLLALENSPISIPLPYPVTRDRVPTILNNGFSGLQGFGPYDNFSDKHGWSGSFTWIAGSHTMKFGAMYSLYRKNENALAGNNEGVFNAFNTPGGTTAVIAPGGSTLQQQFANFLLGTNVNFSQASFDYTADLRQKTFEAYAQDEWRFRPNLTLYMGVRYSFFGSPWDRNGRLTNFVPELFDPSAAPLVTGAGNRVAAAGKNFCNGLIANTQNYTTGPANFNCTPIQSPWGKFIMDAPKNDFAPRVGFAWDPFGKGRTAIRTGYGIYHEQILSGIMLQHIGLNPPYQQTCTVTGVSLDNPVPGGNCTAAASALAPNIRGIQADWETPYMQHWSLDFQQQLTDKTLVTVGYYGSKGTNLIGAFELNEIRPGVALSSMCATGASTTPTVACQTPGTGFLAANRILDQLRPYRGYQSLNIVQPRYDSNYHSLQISAQQRFSGASQVNVAYTWSKNLTNNLTDRSSAPQNSYDLESEWGRAALDRRHIFTLNYVYELPFFREQQGFVGKILGGWQASGIISYNTGLPFTVTTSSFDPAGVGLISALVAGGRPNLLCDPNQGAPRTQQQYFNTACFAPNPTSATNVNISNNLGSSPRSVLHGPPTRRVDFTLSRNFRFSETMRLQLRGEAFNVFNWTNFRGLSTNVTAANFGQVISVRDPRTLQFGAKFYW
ncbi:MAG TPA: TonB-dependent receptor [Pyrinomonadaceae bacterium]|nr:TonB-dependent receptor [Pyrinomonadaceae bacterium]